MSLYELRVCTKASEWPPPVGITRLSSVTHDSRDGDSGISSMLLSNSATKTTVSWTHFLIPLGHPPLSPWLQPP